MQLLAATLLAVLVTQAHGQGVTVCTVAGGGGTCCSLGPGQHKHISWGPSCPPNDSISHVQVDAGCTAVLWQHHMTGSSFNLPGPGTYTGGADFTNNDASSVEVLCTTPAPTAPPPTAKPTMPPVPTAKPTMPPVPTAKPTPATCKHLEGTTGLADILLCMDDTTCNGAVDGWDCCTCRGGRKQCPSNFPELCETPNGCGGGTAHCCSTNCADPNATPFQGGVRTCPAGNMLAWRPAPPGHKCPTPAPVAQPTQPPVDPVAVCSQFHGDKKNCKKAHKRQPSWGTRPPCFYDRKLNLCQYWQCKSFDALGWNCHSKGKKKGLTCYHHMDTQTCETTNPNYSCADLDADKKTCVKWSKAEQATPCMWDRRGKPSKCVNKGTPKDPCAKTKSARRCNKIAGCTFGPNGCVQGTGGATPVGGCARHSSRGSCNADPLCSYDKKTKTCN